MNDNKEEYKTADKIAALLIILGYLFLIVTRIAGCFNG